MGTFSSHKHSKNQVYILKEKSDVEGVFIEFYSMIETQLHTKIQVFRNWQWEGIFQLYSL